MIGTGKRVGKTAVTAHVARLLASDRSVVVVAMGRGGPARARARRDGSRRSTTCSRCRGAAAMQRRIISRQRRSPESSTIGCRRAGGGLAGTVSHSNVVAGAELARSLEPDVVVFDGSGAAIPPVATSARILVTTAGHDLDALPQPLPRRDLRPRRRRRRRARRRRERRACACARCSRSAAAARPSSRPAPHRSSTSTRSSCTCRATSRTARRCAPSCRAIDAEVFLVELKAAAIDVVAEEAAARGVELVLAANDVSGDGLDDAILDLLPAAGARVTSPSSS